MKKNTIKLTNTIKTQRGFNYQEFVDFNDTPCNIQESSVATEACLWLGAKDIGVKQFTDEGWKDIEFDDSKGSVVANNRMHLSQRQVKELLPTLRYFAKHGVLPEPVPVESLADA